MHHSLDLRLLIANIQYSPCWLRASACRTTRAEKQLCVRLAVPPLRRIAAERVSVPQPHRLGPGGPPSGRERIAFGAVTRKVPHLAAHVTLHTREIFIVPRRRLAYRRALDGLAHVGSAKLTRVVWALVREVPELLAHVALDGRLVEA